MLFFLRRSDISLGKGQAIACGDTEMTSVDCDLKTDLRIEISPACRNSGRPSGCQGLGTNRVQGCATGVLRAGKDCRPWAPSS